MYEFRSASFKIASDLKEAWESIPLKSTETSNQFFNSILVC